MLIACLISTNEIFTKAEGVENQENGPFLLLTEDNCEKELLHSQGSKFIFLNIDDNQELLDHILQISRLLNKLFGVKSLFIDCKDKENLEKIN